MTAVNGSTNVSMSLVGTFRDIQDEAKGTSVGRAVLGATDAVQVLQGSADADPLTDGKIQNRALIFTERRLLTGEDFTVADEVARTFGLDSVAVFAGRLMEDICGRTDVAGLDLRQRLVYPDFKFIAAALLSSDAIRSVLSGAGATGFAIKGDDLFRTALAVCALVSEGRLAIEDVPVYVSRKVCDARSVDDVAGMTQALLNQMRDSVANGGVQTTIRALAEKVEERANGLQSGPELTRLRKLRDVLNAQMKCCRAARSGMLPEGVISRQKVKGVINKKVVGFENAQDYLEHQFDSLHDFLKSGPRPDFNAIAEVEQTAAKAILAALRECPVGIDSLIPDADERTEWIDELEECAALPANTSSLLQESYQTDVIDVAKVACRQMEFALRADMEFQVRQAQENALRKLGYKPGMVPPRGAVFAVGLALRAGGRFGISNGKVKAGVSASYNMIVKIDESGKVRLLGLARMGLELEAAADLLLGCKASAKVAGGLSFGRSAVYDSTLDMLEDSSSLVADALMRVNGGVKGLFYSKGKTDALARKVDNAGYVDALKKYGILDDFDDFSTRPLNNRVTSKEKVSVSDGGVEGKVVGDGPLAAKIVSDARIEVKAEYVKTTRKDYRPVTDIALDLAALRAGNGKIDQLAGALEAGNPLKLQGAGDAQIQVDPRKHVLARLAELEKELDDFERAVRYADWQADRKRYGKGSMAGFVRPRLTEEAHLRRRGITAGSTNAKTTEANRAAFLRALADELRFCRALAGISRAKADDVDDGKAHEQFLSKVGFLAANLRERILSPRIAFKSGVLDKAPLALRRALYVSETHAATALSRIHIGAFYHCGYGLGGVLPEVGRVADTFKNNAPGIHLGLDREAPTAGSKTGVPHEDATTWDLTIGFSNFPGNAMLTSALKSFLLKAGFGAATVKEIVPFLLDSMKLANTHKHLIGGVQKLFKEPVAPKRVNNADLDLGFGKVSFDLTSDGGLALRFRLQGDAGGKLRLGRCDLVSRSDSRYNVDLESGKFYAGVGFSMFSEMTFQRTLLAHSLTPFLSEFAAYDVRRRGVYDPGWLLFLKQNDQALADLAECLKKNDGNVVMADFKAYTDMAAEVDVQNGRAEFGKRMGDSLRLILQATTPEERQTAFSNFGLAVSDLSEQYRKLNRPPSKDGANEADRLLANLPEMNGQEFVVDENGSWQLQGKPVG